MTPVSKTKRLCFPSAKEITIWNSDDMYVWVQGFMWNGGRAIVQLIPTKLYGYVAITKRGVGEGCVPPIYKWLIVRPCALQIEYDSSVRTEFKALPAIRMLRWYETWEPWTRVCLPTR